jgi:hypothetical protein
LAAKGVQIYQGDANDTESIKAAVQDADIVFGNTVFSDAMINPESAYANSQSRLISLLGHFASFTAFVDYIRPPEISRSEIETGEMPESFLFEQY